MSEETTVGGVQREEVLRVIPSLAFTVEGTTFKLYREYWPLRDVIEFTIFYREPGKDKYRITAEVDVMSGDEVGPNNFRITEWRKYEGSRT